MSKLRVGSIVKVKYSSETNLYLGGFGFSKEEVKEHLKKNYVIVCVGWHLAEVDKVKYFVNVGGVSGPFFYEEEIELAPAEEDLSEWV